MSIARSDQDPFQKMLAWSGAFHGLLFTSLALASYLGASGPALPAPNVGMFINLGESGPIQGAGGGSPTPPEPEPEPEPPKNEPKVVRPTVEQREELPAPDASVKKKPRWEKPKQDSGLRGADAAIAESAPLKGNPGAPGLGGVGGGSAFDQDFEYAYYVQQMLGRIHQNWQRTPVRGTAVVIVRFTILKNGSVANVEIEQSSPLSILDRNARRAVILAEPMPPLPNSYPRDRVDVHLRFTYSDNY